MDKVGDENPDFLSGSESASFRDQLLFERNAYDLMLKMLESDELVAKCEVNKKEKKGEHK